MVLLARSIFVFCLLFLFSCGVSKEKAGRAQAHYKLGVSFLTENNVQPAFVEFQKAIELDPSNKEFHNALGIVYMKLSDPKKAEEEFKKATRIDSEYSEGYNNLCYIYYTGKQYEKATENCKKAIVNPFYQTPEKAYFNLGRINYRLRKYDDAVTMYWEAIRRSPSLYIAYYWLALAHNAKGQYGEASTALNKAIELDPKFKGDRKKAEADIRSGKLAFDEPADQKDTLDILHY